METYLDAKLKMPTLYKVIYHDTVYAIGVKIKKDLEERHCCYYQKVLRHENGGFNKKFTSLQMVTSDVLTPIDTIDEHLAILDALENEGMYYNRKKMELIKK